jgi:hypothetical protein
MADLPIVCTLDEETLKTRRENLLPGLIAEAGTREELEDGFRLRFAQADVLPRLLRVIETERKCCRFLRFEVALEPDLGPISLTVTGPPGTREFLAALVERPAGGVV